MLQIINPRDPDDWTGVKRLCAQTGSTGSPISFDRFPFFGEYWIGPYEALRPKYTFIALENDSQNILGYVTGCPDTSTFEKERRLYFYPRLALRHFPAVLRKPNYEMTSDEKRFLKQMVGLYRPAEKKFARDIQSHITQNYPAHLHINCDAAFRGQGLGRRLCETLFNKFRQENIKGIHVSCGEKPVKFYLSLGFKIEAHIMIGGTKVNLLTKEFR